MGSRLTQNKYGKMEKMKPKVAVVVPHYYRKHIDTYLSSD